MVIGLLTLAAIPTVTGVAMGVSEQRKANERKMDARRMARFNIDVDSSGETQEEDEVRGKRIVLRDNKVLAKVYLDDPIPSSRKVPSHTAEAFYIDYPELDETKHLKRGLGLVTTISDNPPMLGWIYVDEETHELKYGNRSQSVYNVVGPWDWANEETTLILEEESAFYAVQEDDGSWAVYFDRDGDELEYVLEEQEKLDNPFAPITLKRTMVPPPIDPSSKNGNS
ncbi:uncharacterized protein ACLA_019260 [Aspergillus clavatus NRRL 1]|uniref:Uncharacterized protein n=1 Tax=Aspergillus clavatus (strain ATCC 1007 / CBS 513.65 / DSM 816 / NCTC 3887 / NRRL 1 / QM 1276 / 107) TaxID=344612 RepID=A1CNK0_ASPCL|nr:uncharacterized protein ACLA_019260 [Aspergillus clavatus NRRL 1]EAW07221.1 conserved hypothetical protein [Aspergillus clavatus NRRL 1]